MYINITTKETRSYISKIHLKLETGAKDVIKTLKNFHSTFDALYIHINESFNRLKDAFATVLPIFFVIINMYGCWIDVFDERFQVFLA